MFAAFVSLLLVIVYYPSGEDALYNFPYLIGCGLAALLAAVSLVHPDPLHLGRRASRSPDPQPVPAATAARDAADHRCRVPGGLSSTRPGSPIRRCGPPTPPAGS